MYFRKKVRSRLFVFYVKKVFNTGGLNSNLADGSHVPCFDFDNLNLREVETILRHVQEKYKLSTIIIWNTGREDSYNAIALTRLDFRQALQVAFDTPHIDLNFIRFAIWRGHFTLRILPKNNRALRVASVLDSKVSATIKKSDIKSFTFYETSSG